MKHFKHIVLLLAGAVLLFGCSKKSEAKLETFSAEAFAYDVDAAWEINSSIRVKGFVQQEIAGAFKHEVVYSASIITPSGEVISGIGKGELKETAKEKVTDLGIEFQYELDKTKGAGKYKIVYEIKDQLSGTAVKGEKVFEVM